MKAFGQALGKADNQGCWKTYRSKDEAANLHIEANLRPRVVVHDDSPSIACSVLLAKG